MWGFDASHLATEGPINTPGGDIGGNMTIRFNAVGEVGPHIIRGYIGAKDTPVYLSCEIGGQAVFNIVGPSSDSKAILTNTGTLTTSVGSLITAVGNVKSATDTEVNYVLGALGLSVVNLLLLVVLLARRKT